MQRSKGLFVTFEGGEGAGKSTLINRVYQFFLNQQIPVVKTREPGGTPFGEAIRQLLLEKKVLSKKAELFLFLADRAQHVEEFISPYLLKNYVVLCDRFTDSTLAYQGAARHLDTAFVETLSLFAASDLTPDLTLFLDLDPAIGLQRVLHSKKFDRIEQETLAFHEEVRKAFQDIVKKNPQRCTTLDAAQPPNLVFEQALEKIKAAAC